LSENEHNFSKLNKKSDQIMLKGSQKRYYGTHGKLCQIKTNVLSDAAEFSLTAASSRYYVATLPQNKCNVIDFPSDSQTKK